MGRDSTERAMPEPYRLPAAGKYADFTGRAGRPEFWWWALFDLLVTAALSLFTPVRVGGTTLGALLVGLWSIAVLLPYLAVAVRRLRDADYGWGHLFWALVPVAGLVVLAVYLSEPTCQPAPEQTPSTPA
jgi:uncharacterized membrane protein YhaH (DUF805 family)